jgi:hypothetical protein
MRGNADGREVAVRRVANISGMAAGHHDCGQHRRGAAQSDGHAVTHLQTFLRQCQPAKPIIAIEIGGREIDRKFGSFARIGAVPLP